MTALDHPDYIPHYIAVYALLRRDDTFLFMRRTNTDYMNGYYGLPAGRIALNETVLQGALREAHEETGLIIKPEQAKLCHIQHRYDAWQKDAKRWIDFYYLVDEWDGEPIIAEPDKADDIKWLTTDTTENIIPRLRPALKSIARGEMFSLSGDWLELQGVPT